MKGIDIFCASQAATAVCLSTNGISSSSSPPPPPTSSSSSSIQLGRGSGSRAIDRFNPIITDPTRNSDKAPHQKSNNELISKKKKKSSKTSENKNGFVSGRKSWSCTRPGDFITPPGSTRYLLSDDQALLNMEVSSDFHPVFKLPNQKPPHGKADESSLIKSPPSSLCCSQQNQVVVLRVSLHCRGCEKKMRKHISRMQGVASFEIDFAAKKVTITGNVTPLEVLADVSKVKKAQLLAPPTTSSSSSSFSSSSSSL